MAENGNNTVENTPSLLTEKNLKKLTIDTELSGHSRRKSNQYHDDANENQSEVHSNDEEYEEESSLVTDSDDEDDVHVEVLKVLVVGMAKSGKTSIIRRYIEGTFSDVYRSTVGADFVFKDVEYGSKLQLNVQIWDIAGQDRFAKLTRSYFSDASGAIIVCDITRENTIEAVSSWKEEIDKCCEDMHEDKTIPVILIANKSDLLTDPERALELGMNMQKTVVKTGIDEWFRVSAKSGEKVEESMQVLIKSMVERYYAKKDAENERLLRGSMIEDSRRREGVIRLSEGTFDNTHIRKKKSDGACDCS